MIQGFSLSLGKEVAIFFASILTTLNRARRNNFLGMLVNALNQITSLVNALIHKIELQSNLSRSYQTFFLR